MNGIARAVALAAALAGAAPGGRPPVDTGKLQAQYRAARIQRNIGWGLAAAGIALLAGGAIALGYAARDNVQTYEQHVAEAIGGAVAMVVGVAFAIPGAVLSLRGQENMSEAIWRLRAAGFLSAGPGGAMATLRVIF